MEYTGDPPWLDLDNLAKAILDAIKGHAFHDDAQVGRLLVERRAGDARKDHRAGDAALAVPGLQRAPQRQHRRERHEHAVQ